MTYTSAALFAWEIESFGKKLLTLDNIEAFRALSKELGGNLANLYNSKAARKIYGSFETLKYCCWLRELQWKKRYRGIVGHGKVSTVRFRSELTEEEDKFLEENLRKLKKMLISV